MQPGTLAISAAITLPSLGWLLLSPGWLLLAFVEPQIEEQNVNSRLAQEPSLVALGVPGDQLPHIIYRQSTDAREACDLVFGSRRLICGSRQLSEAVIRSTGGRCVLLGSAVNNAAIPPMIASLSAGFVVPSLEPLLAKAGWYE